MPLDYPLWLRATHRLQFPLFSRFSSAAVSRSPKRASATLLERSLHARQRMAEVHEKAETHGQALDGQRRGKFVSVSDCPPRPRKSGPWPALAFSRRLRMVTLEWTGLYRDVIRIARVAPPDSGVMANCAGSWPRAAQLPDLSHRGSAGNLQRAATADLRGRRISACALQHRNGDCDVTRRRRPLPVVHQ